MENRDKTFGGSFGGPVIFPRFGEGGPSIYSGKNKLFFFFAYEGLRTKTNQPYERYIETTQLRQFIAGRNGVSAQIINSSGAMPRVISILPRPCNADVFPNGNACANVTGGVDIGSPAGSLGRYFAGNQSVGGGLDGIPDLQYALLENPQSTEGNQYVIRFDYDATDRDKFAFSLFYSPRTSFGADTGAQSRPMADNTSDRLNYNAAFSYIRNLSATFLNEARINYTKWGFDEVKSNPNANFGIPRVEIESFLPSDRLRWGFNRGANTPGTLNETQLNLRDTLTWIFGNHALKFGGEYRRDENINPGTGAQRPIYSFVGPWNFGNDTPIFEAISADFNGQPFAKNADFRTGGTAFFVQDDWKMRPNFTLNFGLRWEYFKVLEAENLGVFQFGPPSLPESFIVDGGKLTEPDYNNFGPQAGFAWTPRMFDDKLVLRGGFGLGYDRIPNALPANARANPPNGFRFSVCCASNTNPFVNNQILYVLGSSNAVDSFPRNPNLGGGRNANGGPNVGTVEIYGLDHNLRQPQVTRYSIEAQYDMFWQLVGTLGYQGSRSKNFV